MNLRGEMQELVKRSVVQLCKKQQREIQKKAIAICKQSWKRVKQRTRTGDLSVMLASELEKSPEYAANEEGYAIKSSQRQDGTWRHPRKVKPGYRPIQELPKYRPPSLKQDAPKQTKEITPPPQLPHIKEQEPSKKSEEPRNPVEEKKMTEPKGKPYKRKGQKVKYIKKGEEFRADIGVSPELEHSSGNQSPTDQRTSNDCINKKMRKNSSSQAFTFSSVLSGLSELGDDVSDISLSVATPRENHNPESLKQKFQDFLREKIESNKEEEEPREIEKKQEEHVTTAIINSEVYQNLEPEIKELFNELIPANSMHVFTEPLKGILENNIQEIFKSKEKKEEDLIDDSIKFHTNILETLEQFQRGLTQAQENNEGAELLKLLLEEDEPSSKKEKKSLKPKIDFDLFLSSSSDQERQYSFNTGSYVQIPPRLSIPLTDRTLTIKPLTPEQILKYRASQKERYIYPERPWIYSTSDKRNAVVGPVVSEKQKQVNNLSLEQFRAKKILGWDYLKQNPSFINLPLLVKDALARLPHGMGTLADVVQMLRASAFLTIPEERISKVRVDDFQLFSIVKVILTELSHRGDKPMIQLAEADSSVSRHSQVKEIWVYASSGKSIDDWMKAADIEKRKPKIKQKESSRKIKISLDQSLLKTKKSYSEEPPLSKKTKFL